MRMNSRSSERPRAPRERPRAPREQPPGPHEQPPPPSEQPPAPVEYKSRAKRAYTSRRPRSPHYEVRHLPPPWKRSLTESAMHRKLTRLDVAAVLLFVLAFLGLVVWVLQTGYA